MTQFISDTLPAGGQSSRGIRRILTGTWVDVAALFVLALCLWLPFGFNVSFWADEWWMFQDGGRLPWVALESSRPFVSIPWHIVYLFSPNSFTGTNVLLLLLIFGKGAAFYAILRRLVRQREIAFAAAALVVVYPADTAVFNLGTLSIHFALFCYVLAAWLLVESWVTGRWYLLVVALLALAMSVGIYEVVYPLALVTPLVLLRFEHRPTKRLIGYAMAWYIIPVIGGLRLVSLYINQQGVLSYQSGLFSGLPNPGETVAIIQNVFVQHFYTGWIGSGELFGREYLQYAALAAVLVLVLLLGLAWLCPTTGRRQRRNSLWTAVGGLIILLLGFAVYLATDLRNSTDRTHFYSSLGAALVIVGLLWLLSHTVFRHTFAFAVLIAALVGVGLLRNLEQHSRYAQVASEQVDTLAKLVSQVPSIMSSTGLVIMDESPEQHMIQTFTYSSFYFRGTVTLIYDDPTLNTAICYPGRMERWGTFLEYCEFSETEYALDASGGAIGWSKPYDGLIVLRYTPEQEFIVVSDLTPYTEFAVAGYEPTERFDSDGDLPLRAVTMLGMSPQDSRNSP